MAVQAEKKTDIKDWKRKKIKRSNHRKRIKEE